MASITLTFTGSVPAPVNGYRIKYWRTATPGTVITVTPNVTSSPYTITGLENGTNYSGTIEASCAGGTYSTPVSWSVTATTPYYYYNATKFDCANNCQQLGTSGGEVVVSLTQLTVGTFYKVGGYTYRLDSVGTSSGSPVNISSYTSFGSSCFTACNPNGGAGGGSLTYSYWDMREVDCYSGNTINNNVTVAFTGSFTPATYRYYKPIGGGSSVYYNTVASEAPSTISPILSTNAFTTYIDACNSNTAES